MRSDLQMLPTRRVTPGGARLIWQRQVGTNEIIGSPNATVRPGQQNDRNLSNPWNPWNPWNLWNLWKPWNLLKTAAPAAQQSS